MVILASSLTRSSSSPLSAQFMVICRINSSEVGKKSSRKVEGRRRGGKEEGRIGGGGEEEDGREGGGQERGRIEEERIIN